MDGFNTSAILAMVLGFFLLPLAFIPYVAWSFRRGTTGPGHALISALGLVYLMALWTYTIAPLPQTADLICDGTLRAQVVPLRFLGDIDTSGGVGGLLGDPALRQGPVQRGLLRPAGDAGASGLIVVDSREPDLRPGAAQRGTDPRRLSSAVVLIGAVAYWSRSPGCASTEVSPTGACHTTFT